MAFDNEIMRERLAGHDCILAYETAADYLGICSQCSHRKTYHAYALEEPGIEWLDCIIVPSFDNLETVTDGTLVCTSPRQTIIDLLLHDRDDQVILETLADYYFSHNESFDGLNLPEDAVPIFESYKDDAVSYYSY